MCLYPRLIINRKYVPNKKNNYNAPQLPDNRVLYAPIGCQQCIECKKQKARQWGIRLQEEIRTNKTGQYVTLTFSNEELRKIYIDIYKTMNVDISGYAIDNEIATVATRRFLERWRKKYKTSVKHWLITELGHEGTENVHLHGIIFTENKKDIEEIWKYGFVWIGEYVNEQTINYIIKYVHKMDEDHPNYNAKILTSPGIGANYTNRYDAKTNKYKKGKTDETYQSRNGQKSNLPIYYRNKIYTEEEREQLWLEKLDKQERYVLGSKISIKDNENEYYAALQEAQRKNTRLGYGNGEKDWTQIQYENERRKINIQKRLDKAKENELL